MSCLADLINELCPDGVEKRPLGELLSYEQPTRYLVSSKNYDPSFSTPVLTAGATFLLGFTSETHGIYPASKNDPVIIFDDFTTASKWVDFPFKLKSSAAKILTLADPDKVDIRFLYYLMQGIRYEPTSHARHWISVFSKMPVFCPPLEVQHEIVKILDQFTTLEAELEAELEARRAQYEYYRNQLLSYDALVSRCPNGVQYKSIGSFSKCVAGATPNSKNPSLWDGDIPWMSSGEVNKKTVYSTNRFITQLGFDSCSTKMVPAGAVVIALAGQGKTRGTVARIRIELCTNQSLCAIITDKTVDSDYLFHYLSGQYDNLRAVSSGDGTRGGLNLKMIRAYKVPVPPIEEQRRIADVLDRFDMLVNDISSGLPAEIAARRAQYEYYRDRLLSFPEKK